MADTIMDDGDSVASAAAAIDALFKTGSDAVKSQDPLTGEIEQPNSPQASAPEPEEPAIVAEEVEAPTPVETAPQMPPVPATKAPSSSTELTQELLKAAGATKDAEAVRTQLLNQLNTLVPQMEAAIKGEFADIKSPEDLYKLAETDPARFNRLQIANMKLQYAQTAQQNAQKEQQEVAQREMTKWQAAESNKLAETLPELRDPEKGPVLAKKLHDYAIKNGYSAQQLSQASANDFLILHKAMKADGYEAAQKIAQAKAAKAPPVQQPGVSRPNAGKEDKINADFARLQKTGRDEDAAAMFRHLLQ